MPVTAELIDSDSFSGVDVTNDHYLEVDCSGVAPGNVVVVTCYHTPVQFAEFIKTPSGWLTGGGDMSLGYKMVHPFDPALAAGTKATLHINNIGATGVNATKSWGAIICAVEITGAGVGGVPSIITPVGSVGADLQILDDNDVWSDPSPPITGDPIDWHFEDDQIKSNRTAYDIGALYWLASRGSNFDTAPTVDDAAGFSSIGGVFSNSGGTDLESDMYHNLLFRNCANGDDWRRHDTWYDLATGSAPNNYRFGANYFTWTLFTPPATGDTDTPMLHHLRSSIDRRIYEIDSRGGITFRAYEENGTTVERSSTVDSSVNCRQGYIFEVGRTLYVMYRNGTTGQVKKSQDRGFTWD